MPKTGCPASVHMHSELAHVEARSQLGGTLSASGAQVPLTMPGGRANYSGPVVGQEASGAALSNADAHG